MYTPGFTPRDLVFNGPQIDISTLDLTTLHLLLRRAPVIVYSLEGDQRLKLIDHIRRSKDSGSINRLLLKMLGRSSLTTATIIKRVRIKMGELIGDKAMDALIANKPIGRDEVQKKLQEMFFSEKSSFAQSGVFIAAAVERIISEPKVFFKEAQLSNAHVDVVLASAVDTVEHSVFADLMPHVKGEVGRLLTPRKHIDAKSLAQENRVGRFSDTSSQALEVIVGDADLHYPEVTFDDTGALVVALCPSEIRDQESGIWRDAGILKAYPLEESVIKEVIAGGGSRKALKGRQSSIVSQSDFLEAGQMGIYEIPLDIGPYDADIEIVCVGSDGHDIEIFHFPATYLDAVRTFSDKENRVQVEIKNVGPRAVRLKDIHFRVRLYETDKKTRQKWELRKIIQAGEQKGFYPLEHMLYTKVLKGNGGGLEDHMAALGDLANLDNLFRDEEGMIFYQLEKNGQKVERCETLKYIGETLPHLELTSNIILEPVIVSIGTGYQQELVTVLQNASGTVGREKRVTFICRNDIDEHDASVIVKTKGVTDILSIPGKNSTPRPSQGLVQLCSREKIALTSIEVIVPPTADASALYDLVGAKRESN